ncbi:LPS assembly lipoprotein LptE [Allomesorhizobium alhagi]|uniref:LPS assembly lipoprotein LptE n=1 Tax=Allomesorhizobium alhagi TaxID=475067 RepID=UPI00030604D9
MAAYPSIDIKPVQTRYAQEVRNHLIFMLNGGAGQPANPQYSLDLGVTEVATGLLLAATTTGEDRPSAGTIVMTSSYRLTKVGTGEVVARGTRRISSSYDRPRQEFAALRAQRDAENRAARELAELLKLAIGQDLSRL